MTPQKLREHARVLRGLYQTADDALSFSLNAAADLLEREAHALETQHTHSPGCWQFGRAHYECAINQIGELLLELESLQNDVASACEWPESETWVERIRRWKIERDTLADEVERCWLLSPIGLRVSASAAVAAILAERKENRP